MYEMSPWECFKSYSINVVLDCFLTAVLGQGTVQYVCFFKGSEVKWQNHNIAYNRGEKKGLLFVPRVPALCWNFRWKSGGLWPWCRSESRARAAREQRESREWSLNSGGIFIIECTWHDVLCPCLLVTPGKEAKVQRAPSDFIHSILSDFKV